MKVKQLRDIVLCYVVVLYLGGNPPSHIPLGSWYDVYDIKSLRTGSSDLRIGTGGLPGRDSTAAHQSCSGNRVGGQGVRACIQQVLKTGHLSHLCCKCSDLSTGLITILRCCR